MEERAFSLELPICLSCKFACEHVASQKIRL